MVASVIRDGRAGEIAVHRLTAADAGSVLQFGAAPGTQWVCLGPREASREAGGAASYAPGGRSGDLAFVAKSPSGAITGLAGIRPATSSFGERGDLTLVLSAGHHRDDTVIALLRATARAARLAGVKRLEARLCREAGHTLEEFRAAGLLPVSTFNLGGVTEVVLEIGSLDSLDL